MWRNTSWQKALATWVPHARVVFDRFLGEGERDDVARLQGTGPFRGQQMHHAACDDLRLAGSGAGDELEVAAVMLDGSTLCLGEIGRAGAVPPVTSPPAYATTGHDSTAASGGNRSRRRRFPG